MHLGLKAEALGVQALGEQPATGAFPLDLDWTSGLIQEAWFLADELRKQPRNNIFDGNTNIMCTLKWDPFSFDYRNVKQIF